MPLLSTVGAARLRGEAATTWEVARLPDKFSPIVNDSAFQFELRKNGEPFLVKGVCYSPLEINQNFGDMRIDTAIWPPKGSTTFGDLFWDDPGLAPQMPLLMWVLGALLISIVL